MFQPYIGLVIPFAGNFPPAGWMFCQGQELSISEYPELFNLIGTLYGGDGMATFALPDLCGRVAVHAGQAPGMQRYIAGQSGGNEKVFIAVNNLPAHNHAITGGIAGTAQPCSNTPGTLEDATNNYPAIVNSAANQYSSTNDASITMGTTPVSVLTQPAPGAMDEVKDPIYIMSPYLAINYIISITGIWPSMG